MWNMMNYQVIEKLRHIITFQFDSMIFHEKSTNLAKICMHANSVLPWKTRKNTYDSLWKKPLRHVCVVPCIWSLLNQNHSPSTSSSIMHAWILITSENFQSQQNFIKTYKKCWIGSLSFQRKANILALSSLRMFPGISPNVMWIV